MFRKFFRFIFLSVVFVSGVLIGGIYTPEITKLNQQESDRDKVEQQDIKSPKKKRSKNVRVV